MAKKTIPIQNTWSIAFLSLKIALATPKCFLSAELIKDLDNDVRFSLIELYFGLKK
ncbi:hypothetical protein [Methanobacterium sp. SMA-27]|uniref:hypothetical protein n=1 Tax=Methanobacterium sp. SMA-27 TaxID=1495336 RepID=UPI000ADCD703|nr:hypothetical protein [Methanobacterium sp. SMA-27]